MKMQADKSSKKSSSVIADDYSFQNLDDYRESHSSKRNLMDAIMDEE